MGYAYTSTRNAAEDVGNEEKSIYTKRERKTSAECSIRRLILSGASRSRIFFSPYLLYFFFFFPSFFFKYFLCVFSFLPFSVFSLPVFHRRIFGVSTVVFFTGLVRSQLLRNDALEQELCSCFHLHLPYPLLVLLFTRPRLIFHASLEFIYLFVYLRARWSR